MGSSGESVELELYDVQIMGDELDYLYFGGSFKGVDYAVRVRTHDIPTMLVEANKAIDFAITRND
jgi:hypothetical protein